MNRAQHTLTGIFGKRDIINGLFVVAEMLYIVHELCCLTVKQRAL